MRSRFILFALMLACNAGHAQKFTNNYKRIKTGGQCFKGNDPTSVVVVKFDSREYAPDKKTTVYPTIADLKGRGQQELIARYAVMDTLADALKKRVFEPYEKQTPESNKVLDDGRLSYARRLTFFIEDKWADVDPANRIQSLRLTLKLKNRNLKFEKFDGFQTKYESHNFGKLTDTKVNSFNIGGELGLNYSGSTGVFDANSNQTSGSGNGTNIGVSASYARSRTLSEEVSPSRRYLAQTGMLSDNQVMIYMEGAPGKNLNGPIVVDIHLSADDLSDNEMEYQEVVRFYAKGKKHFLYPYYIIKPNDTAVAAVLADVSIEWSYRQVFRKGKTSPEGDDVIKICTFPLTDVLIDQVVIATADLKEDVFNIRSQGERVVIKHNTSGSVSTLRFLARAEAMDFKRHVTEKQVLTLGDHTLYRRGSGDTLIALTLPELSGLVIEKDAF
jgi:hypothetical protein